MAGVEGRVALVTGAGRGIGLAAARLLTERGASVMCVSRTESELAATGLPFTVADLGTQEGCALAVSETEKHLGPAEILVCNHGIGSARERVVWEQDPALWNETIRINLDGPFYLSRLALRSMIAQGYGRLVYTSSTAGEVADCQAAHGMRQRRGVAPAQEGRERGPCVGGSRTPAGTQVR